MRTIYRTILASWIGLALAGTAIAGPLEDGKAAYQRKDYPAAAGSYRVAATQGNAKAQTLLGEMYDFGMGVAEDKVEAVKWYRLAAAQGDAAGQFNLGSMYEYGNGVAKDPAEAIKWYRLAAAQGDELAIIKLGD